MASDGSEILMRDLELLAEYQNSPPEGTTDACLYELIDKLNLLEFLSHSRDGAHTIRTNQDKLEQALRKLHNIVMLNYKESEIQTIEWPII